MMLELAVLTILPGAVAFAAAMDIFTMTIPNRISVVLVLSFFPLALLAGLDLSQIAAHVGAGFLLLAVGFVLFVGGWFGGGDAKLMAAVALWVGMDAVLPYLLCVALAGGFIATVFGSVRSVPLPTILLGESWALRLHRQDGGIPYGIALAAGALLVFPQTVWFERLAG
jgi:prepilin peptidase CpaA